MDFDLKGAPRSADTEGMRGVQVVFFNCQLLVHPFISIVIYTKYKYKIIYKKHSYECGRGFGGKRSR
jgi:hypothetical protein